MFELIDNLFVLAALLSIVATALIYTLHLLAQGVKYVSRKLRKPH